MALQSVIAVDNGKVIGGGSSTSTGGLTQEEHGWLEAIYDTRVSMPNVNDVNPNYYAVLPYKIVMPNSYCYMEIAGYSEIGLVREGSSTSNITVTYQFYFGDGTIGSEATVTVGTTVSTISIPSGAIGFAYKSNASSAFIYYGLKV